MIDLHAHILPGIDDGPATMDDACALARAAVDDGIQVMAATPHVRQDYPTTPDQMHSRAWRRSVRASPRSRFQLVVLPGAEIALDALVDLSRDDLRGSGSVGGNRRCLWLLETPYVGWPPGVGPDSLPASRARFPHDPGAPGTQRGGPGTAGTAASARRGRRA